MKNIIYLRKHTMWIYKLKYIACHGVYIGQCWMTIKTRDLKHNWSFKLQKQYKYLTQFNENSQITILETLEVYKRHKNWTSHLLNDQIGLNIVPLFTLVNYNTPININNYSNDYKKKYFIQKVWRIIPFRDDGFVSWYQTIKIKIIGLKHLVIIF